MRNAPIKRFHNYCGLKKIARGGFPWEKTAKTSLALIYTYCETALVVALVTALLMLGAAASAGAQDRPAQNDNGQSVPDAPAPQPQKKPAAKPQSGAAPSSNEGSTDSSSHSEPPPDKTGPPAAGRERRESLSRGRFPRRGQGSSVMDRPPRDSSSTGKPESAAPRHPPSTLLRTTIPFLSPFPAMPLRLLEIRRTATPGPTRKPRQERSSSRRQLEPVQQLRTTSKDGAPKVTDPVLAKKDTSVGGYYLKTGDYQGAFLRYKEAMASIRPMSTPFSVWPRPSTCSRKMRKQRVITSFISILCPTVPRPNRRSRRSRRSVQANNLAPGRPAASSSFPFPDRISQLPSQRCYCAILGFLSYLQCFTLPDKEPLRLRFRPGFREVPHYARCPGTGCLPNQLNEVRGLDAETTQLHPNGLAYKWSAQQVVEHLVLGYRLTARQSRDPAEERPAFPQTNAHLVCSGRCS